MARTKKATVSADGTPINSRVPRVVDMMSSEDEEEGKIRTEDEAEESGSKFGSEEDTQSTKKTVSFESVVCKSKFKIMVKNKT